jgi:uncharacterized protein (TIGR03067 family)
MIKLCHFLTYVSTLTLSLLSGCTMNTPPNAQSADATAPGTPGAETAPAELPSHEGTWIATSATLAGSPFPSSVTDTISLVASGEQYEVKVGGKADKGTCIADRRTSPNRMTITGIEGPNAGKTFLAVFDFPDPTQMRICYDLNGTAFPTAFESTTENGWFLVSYKRTK